MTTTTLSRSLANHRVLDRIDLQAVGGAVIRYGLAGVIGWIGLMKFTRVEAEAIRPRIAGPAQRVNDDPGNASAPDHAAGHPAAFIDKPATGGDPAPSPQ